MCFPLDGFFSRLQDKQGGESEHINLKVLGQDNAVVQFKIKRHTPLRKLMNAYCDRAVSALINKSETRINFALFFRVYQCKLCVSASMAHRSTKTTLQLHSRWKKATQSKFINNRRAVELLFTKYPIII